MLHVESSQTTVDNDRLVGLYTTHMELHFTGTIAEATFRPQSHEEETETEKVDEK